MKQKLKEWAQRHQGILQWVFYAFPGVLFWFISPYIATLQYAPFESIGARLLGIAGLYGGWILGPLLFSPRAKLLIQDKETKEAVKVLKEKFQGALNFLKDHQKGSVKINQLPWYLVVGESQSGKTTLLANSEEKFILSRKIQNLINVSPSAHPDWWVASKGVYVDVPYVQSSGEKTKSILWLQFCDLLKRYRAKACEGVLWVIDFQEIVHLSKKQGFQRFSKMMKQLKTIAAQQKRTLPLHIVINKCDTINGFSECFADLGADERKQLWGFEVSQKEFEENKEFLFEQAIDKLIKRLNEQLIWRMHRERDQSRRHLIKNFPLQLEYVKPRLVDALSALCTLAGENCFDLQSVSLASAIKPPSQNVMVHEDMTHSTAMTRQEDNQTLLQATYEKMHSYFVFEILQRMTQSPFLAPVKIRARIHSRATVIMGVILAFAATSAVWANDFKHHMQSVQEAEQAIAQYQMLVNNTSIDQPHLINVLLAMNALSTAVKDLKDDTFFGFPLHYLYRVNENLTTKATQAYHRALNQQLLPSIRQALFESLQQRHATPLDVYLALEGLSMLQKKVTLNPYFLENELMRTVGIKSDKNRLLMRTMTEHLNELQSIQVMPLTAYQQSVFEREALTLNKRPLENLTYLVLQGDLLNHENAAIDLSEVIHGDALSVDPAIRHLPYLYTAGGFEEVVPDKLFEAVSKVMNGETVLGLPEHHSKADRVKIAEEAATVYLNDYTRYWNDVLAGITLRKAENMIDLNEELLQLLNQSSPLLNYLSLVNQNTSIQYLKNKLAYQSIHQLFLNQGQVIVDLQQALAHLQNEISSVVESHDIDEAAFELVKQKLQNPSEDDVLTQLYQIAAKLPEPVKAWTLQLTDQTWEFLAMHAARLVNKKWLPVYQYYHDNIRTYYPFSPYAYDELSFDRLATFFGNDGIYEKFFTHYLTPFIYVNDKRWEIAPGMRRFIHIPPRHMQELVNAVLVHQMFFPKDHTMPSLNMTFTPIAIDQSLKRFQLTVNGQPIVYSIDGPHVPETLSWPGNTGIRSLTMSFLGLNDKKASSTDKSPWGLFHLIQKSAPSAKVTDNQLFVTFSLRGSAVQYQVNVNTAANPFSVEFYQHFDLPHTLLHLNPSKA